MTTPAPNLGSTTSWVPPGVAVTMAPGAPGTPGTPGPPGIMQSTDSSLTVLRPSVPACPVALNSGSQPQMGVLYPPLSAMAAPPPQGLWLQPPQMGGVPRLPTLPYPAAFPGPFPMLARGMPPSVPVPDSQPPGVTPVGNTGAIPMSSASSVQVAGSSGIRAELPASGLIWLCFHFHKQPATNLCSFFSNDIEVVLFS